MYEDDEIIDPKRTVKKLEVKASGLFSGGHVNVEYDPIKYEWVDKAKRIIICNACAGTGQKAGRYGWGMENCKFCDGAGTLKLKAPTKEI